ncbi:cation:proton antiporter regulatory subunit [Spirillospora albida]|uniref:cation:proton antiporter regulatory subunit n=1 Tax=Spirillospora albida TaxID=58123 RepID=UPI0004BEC607|nr:cation:proton antiporter regulatory subunit [Spirillospora albida]
MDVERTSLPGIGLRHVFTTERGRQVGVVSHHTGRRDLVIYDKEDPDSCVVAVALNGDEAGALAELLDTGRVVERLAELQREVEGLMTEQIPLAPGSPYAGRPLSDTRARTRTGASIVAVVRAGQVIASPRPDFVFNAADVVVAVGTAEGTAAVVDILTRG